jgi:hypothetical protein
MQNGQSLAAGSCASCDLGDRAARDPLGDSSAPSVAQS